MKGFSNQNSFLMVSMPMELAQLNALALASQSARAMWSPMSLPVLRFLITLLASRILSMIPELTPSPAIGWIVWAASPIRATRYWLQKPDCMVDRGNDSRLLTIYTIYGVWRQPCCPDRCLFEFMMTLLSFCLNYWSGIEMRCSKSGSASDQTKLTQLSQRGSMASTLPSWQIWQAEVLSCVGSILMVQTMAFCLYCQPQWGMPASFLMLEVMPSLPTTSWVWIYSLPALSLTVQSSSCLSIAATSSSMQLILLENWPSCKFLINALTSSSFSITLAWLSSQFRKDRDYLDTTCTLDISPFCLIRGSTPRLLYSYRLGPFIEYTRWLARGGSYLLAKGIFLSSRVTASTRGDLTRQLARVRPTGPHPAIKTWDATLRMGPLL